MVITSTRRPVRNKSTYHHGDLPQALGNAVLELVAEGGIGRVTLAEVTRRASVSAAAPYRHYKNREDLLVSVAFAAFQRLRARQRQAYLKGADAEAQILGDVSEYFAFAKDEPAAFELLFNSGLSLTHRDLDETSLTGYQDLYAATARLATASPAARTTLTQGIVALVYGNAKMMCENLSPVLKGDEFLHSTLESIRMLIKGFRATAEDERRASVHDAVSDD